MEGADLRRKRSHKPLSNFRLADEVPFRRACAKVNFERF
jgi:hypothetical protein